MGKNRAYGYLFVSYKGDHPPLHVHISRNNKEIGRWDIEHQQAMDYFVMGRNLRKALIKLGYLREAENGRTKQKG